MSDPQAGPPPTAPNIICSEGTVSAYPTQMPRSILADFLNGPSGSWCKGNNRLTLNLDYGNALQLTAVIFMYSIIPESRLFQLDYLLTQLTNLELSAFWVLLQGIQEKVGGAENTLWHTVVSEMEDNKLRCLQEIWNSEIARRQRRQVTLLNKPGVREGPHRSRISTNPTDVDTDSLRMESVYDLSDRAYNLIYTVVIAGLKPQTKGLAPLFADGMGRERFSIYLTTEATTIQDGYERIAMRYADDLWQVLNERLWAPLVGATLPVLPDCDEVWYHVEMMKSKGGPRSQSEAFYTALTFITARTYRTAETGIGVQVKPQVFPDSEYAKLLHRKALLPVDRSIEQDWSGRGQHVEFQTNERGIIREVLQVHQLLGTSASAVVESVRCRRILLARKTVRCNRYFTKEQAIEEVAHLTRLSHPHIVRFIGTYSISNQLAILMYPVASYNLDEFLKETLEIGFDQSVEAISRRLSLKRLFGCLVNAVGYIHRQMIKHMDIKPQNILMRKMTRSRMPHKADWKPYLTDFGIARSYQDVSSVETEGRTNFTRKYAAPEVVDQEKRGFPADIFSLGCVFLEVSVVLLDSLGAGPAGPASHSLRRHYDRLQHCLQSNPDGCYYYHSNIPALRSFVRRPENDFDLLDLHGFTADGFFSEKNEIPTLVNMLAEHPLDRPSTDHLTQTLCVRMACCALEAGSDAIEAEPSVSFDIPEEDTDG